MSIPVALHYAPDNASLCVRLALEETGIAYETRLVDRRTSGQKSSAYLALNPHGLIPVLVTKSGPMFETAAILLWISEQKEGRALMPSGAPRQEALSWLFWLSNSLHPALRMLFYPDQHIEPALVEPLRAKTRERLTEMLDKIEPVAARQPDWLRGDSASALTCYLCPMLRWLAIYPSGCTSWFALGRWPALHDMAKGIEAREASQRAAKREGLGPKPFTHPAPPNPPEGSAT